jgi:asparagine synthase (glutamine-hydrolysing)
MSGIGGILSPGGLSSRASALAQALRRRGTHGQIRDLRDGPTLVHAALRPPSATRPEIWYGNGHHIAWDGRLDNRDDLDRALSQRAEHDLHRIVLVFERWGVPGLSRLMGDFALSIWEARGRRLVLARDAMGVRPLFYRFEDGTLTWGSTPEAVRAGSDAPHDVDEGWVAGYFAHAIAADASPIRSIKALVPGHALVVDGAGPRLQAFSTLVAPPIVPLPDDGSYEERFAELFVEAVRCRLDAGDDATVAADLSGGLDSSSIVCVASRLIA